MPARIGGGTASSTPSPDLLGEAVYAMVELDRERLAGRESHLGARAAIRPPALLACVPALRAGLIEPDIVVDAKSGVSGAGRAPKLANLFSEVNESVRAYGVAGHRHKSEMLEQLRRGRRRRGARSPSCPT